MANEVSYGIDIDGTVYDIIPPLPTESVRGGILAKKRTTENVEVAIGEDGKLYVPNSSGESSESGEAVSTHNTSPDAHNDIRLFLQDLSNRLNVLADSDDETLDQMSEVVAYAKNNKDLIDSITISKVSVTDIVDNLTTNSPNKPLSAAQGVLLNSEISKLKNYLTWVIVDETTDLSTVSFKENSIYYFKKGTYSVGQIDISGIRNIAFLLQEASIECSGNCFISAKNCPDIKIFGGNIDGNSVAQLGIKIENCLRPTISHVTLSNIGSSSLEDTAAIRLLGDCSGFLIDNCCVDGVNSGVVSSDGYIHSYGIQVNRLGSSNTYSRYGIISKCHIDNVAGTDTSDTKADGDGIFINNPPYLDNDGNVVWRDDIDIVIDNCTIENCKKRGIKLASVGVNVINTYVDGEMWYSGIDCQFGHAYIDNCTVVNRSDYNNSITSAIVICEGGVKVLNSTIKAPYGDYTYHPGIRFNKRLPGSVVPDTIAWDDIYIEDCFFDKVSRAVYGYVSGDTSPIPSKGIHIKNIHIGKFNQARAVEISNTMFSSIETFEMVDFRFDYGKNRSEIKNTLSDFVYPISINPSPNVSFELYSKHWTDEPMSGYDGLPTCPHARIIYAGSNMGNITYKEYTGHGSHSYGNRAPDTITSTLSKQLLYNSKVGDMYTNTSNGDIYVCTVAGTSNSIGTWELSSESGGSTTTSAVTIVRWS